MATTQSDGTWLGRAVMRPGTTWLRIGSLASGCCLALMGCSTTKSDVAAPPYTDPPADCSPVHAVGRDSVSRFAGNLYDPSIELRSERPEQEGIGNAVVHIRLNRTYAKSPTPQQETDVETSALAFAHALADHLDSFMP
ncbi:hypothetical protein APR12_003096 [Nocardia amikacinitolerans]|uniref:hypothetical protein n=1 Tax=Nocardia amikacinitolerans TaxID=756689 RepID=UPI000832058C|nr:hypothetical protein [Nocardia amikacinitolerans]MCP2317743.1 hypothetical protein [Nocardia amikacinitolerans]